MNRLFFVLVIVCLLPVAAAAQDAPDARKFSAMAELPGSDGALLFGGLNDDGALDDVWVWAMGMWEKITTQNTPSARYGHTMVSLGDGRILLFGGIDDAGYFLNDLYLYEAGIWEEIFPNGDLPEGRAHHGATVIDDSMYIYGGKDSEETFSSELLEFDILGDTWYWRVDAPGGDYGGGLVNDGEDLFVLANQPGMLWAYDLEANEWSYNQSLTSPDPRHGFTAVQDGDEAFVIGGETKQDQILSDMYVFLFGDLTYEEKYNLGMKLAWASICYGHANKAGDEIVLFGGELEDGTLNGTTYIYSVDNNTWAEGPSADDDDDDNDDVTDDDADDDVADDDDADDDDNDDDDDDDDNGCGCQA